MRPYLAFYPTTTAATSFTSAPIALGDAGNAFIGYTISGADVAGTISLQCSVDAAFTRPLTVTNSSTSITNSADGYFQITDASYPFVRVVWAYSSGTGNITVDVSIREPYIARGG